MTVKRFIFLLFFVQAAAAVQPGYAQDGSLRKADSLEVERQQQIRFYGRQRDLADLVLILFHKDPARRLQQFGILPTKLRVSAGPILEYTLTTGFTGGIAASGAFGLGPPEKTNISSFLIAVKYTQKSQFLLPIETSVWLPGNQYYLLGDYRYLHFPQDTYGFGGFTTPADVYTVNYQYIRFYQFVLKRVMKDLYAGVGYQLDNHWDISQSDVRPGVVTDFTKYGFHDASTSSGIALEVLYDSRKNSINPVGGSWYANFEFIQNERWLGSSGNWNAVLLDVRKYIPVSRKNILALWSYTVLTLQGNPPYLDLPGTGNDTYNNTGRGYEQGRFIGKKMIDLEAEFRFAITNNGLVGGVVFVNAESLSELSSNKLEVVSPGFGVGLRIKFNKFSNTNTCIDYGVGKKGSHGFFGNLGEVF